MTNKKVEPALPVLRATAHESEAAGKMEVDIKELELKATEFDKLIEGMEKEAHDAPATKHLLRFWTGWNTTDKGQRMKRERLRIEINPETCIATIGILGPPHSAYNVYMPKEILERSPIELLYYILTKYKRQAGFIGSY